MRKTLTAGLTALSLILVPAAPVQAETNDALNRAILGLLAAGAIGLVISNANKTTNKAVTVRQQHVRDRHADPRRFSEDQREVRHGRRLDPIPSRCFRQIELGNGRLQQVYTQRCLDRRYDDAAALPRQCLTRLGGHDGTRLGYSAKCLRDRGFRSDQRW